ncbi:hypothetical protein V6N12_071005 [Hibiscus sabdariffa]|uniref:Uncharacterized protein n=1 Tax=Hibiscus sabdariffa TaxID=183260 RepID=A0ABR2FIK0_9ROSI
MNILLPGRIALYMLSVDQVGCMPGLPSALDEFISLAKILSSLSAWRCRLCEKEKKKEKWVIKAIDVDRVDELMSLSGLDWLAGIFISNIRIWRECYEHAWPSSVTYMALCGLNNQLHLHCMPESLLTDIKPIGYQVGSFAERYLSEELNISRSSLVPLDSPEEYALALKRGPRNGDRIHCLQLVSFFSQASANSGSSVKHLPKTAGVLHFLGSPLAIDMSSAILALAENSDLRRIHDKWLMQSTCSLESTEIETSQLNLSSFWGL